MASNCGSFKNYNIFVLLVSLITLIATQSFTISKSVVAKDKIILPGSYSRRAIVLSSLSSIEFSFPFQFAPRPLPLKCSKLALSTQEQVPF